MATHLVAVSLPVYNMYCTCTLNADVMCTCACVHVGAGTFGTVRAGLYQPRNGDPEVKCAIKCLKPTEDLPNQKVTLLGLYTVGLVLIA